ncbi:MAG: hypothetical protein ABI347_02815 [Nitrososphaera sp.]
MKASRPLAFVVLAFVIGATISQASFAFADDSSTNPFRAIWEAISELQTKTDSLQAQIDDLKAQRVAAAPEQAEARVSEPSIAIEVGAGDAGQTAIKVIARNAGPENAVGVKLSTYYQMTLFHVNSIQGAECTDQARGIIECYLGTIDAGSETTVTINASPSALGQQAIITTDISSITSDANPANNHAEAVFVTSEAPVVTQQPVTPVQPQAPALPQNQTQSQPSEQTIEQQPQNQNQTQSQPPEQAPAEQQPQEQAPAESQEPTIGQENQASDQGNSGTQQPSDNSSSSSASSDNGSAASSSGDSGGSGGESSATPPSGDAGATVG